MNEYPKLTCKNCAESHEGIIINGHIISYHMNICDVCNEWKEVSSPSDFAYPKFTFKRDLHKIFSELFRVMKDFQSQEDHSSANEMTHEIDKIIHEILETGGNADGTALIHYRRQRRDIREKSKEARRTMRESTEEPVCEIECTH